MNALNGTASSRASRAWLRIYRAGVVAFILFLLHHQAHWFDSQRPGTISIRVARKFFATANRIQLRDAERGLNYVTDARGDTIGCLLTTSPQTDAIIGYSGPNDLLIALDAQGTIVGVELLSSGDTLEHVNHVKSERGFWRSFVGWKPATEPQMPTKVQAVAGATLTSLAIAEAIQQRLAGAAPSLRFPEPLTLTEVQGLFTNASRMVAEKARWRLLNKDGGLLGYVLRTSPPADNVGGYRGPTECLVALAPNGRTVIDLRIRRSYDTDSYVDQVRTSKAFRQHFVGRTVDEITQLNIKPATVDAVSGATQTSLAIAEGLKRRLVFEQKSRVPPSSWPPAARDWALAGMIAGAIGISFTSLRGHRWVRRGWQALLVIYLGFLSHDFLSLSLFQGWAVHGIAWRSIPATVLLAAAAFVVPWGARRQLYCHHLCAHGAAQQIVTDWIPRRMHRRISPAWERRLEALPFILLSAAIVVALTGVGVSLAAFEPFDAWVWRTAGVVTIAIALVGLIASVFIPHAYCRFGCPTGALLKFIRSSGSGDCWGRRDAAALALVIMSVLVVLTVRGWPKTEAAPTPSIWSGRIMGTTWSVKTFEEVADPGLLQTVISNELAWAESMISHWQPASDLAQFNASRDTNAQPVTWPVVTLARWAAEVSRETGGALDVTVGALVRLWGFGPPPRPTRPPTDAEVDALRPSVGWQHLEISDGMLRKQDPRTEVDLSCLAEGWAIDHITRVLQQRGFTNLLVEVGGEMRVVGRWSIAIEHPTRPCILTNEAIATSGTYRQHHRAGPREVSHLIDARTGRPVSHRTVSVSVRHAECSRADVWATALNILGLDEGMPVAERLGLAAQFVVESDGGRLSVRETSAWRTREAAVAARDLPSDPNRR